MNFQLKMVHYFGVGCKRFPNAIDFDINNMDCFNFIICILLAKGIKVKINDNNDIIKKVVEKLEKPKYIPPSHKLPSREEEINEINKLKNWLNNFDNKKIDINNLIPEKFEKDNDKNNHVLIYVLI